MLLKSKHNTYLHFSRHYTYLHFSRHNTYLHFSRHNTYLHFSRHNTYLHFSRHNTYLHFSRQKIRYFIPERFCGHVLPHNVHEDARVAVAARMLVVEASVTAAECLFKGRQSSSVGHPERLHLNMSDSVHLSLREGTTFRGHSGINR